MEIGHVRLSEMSFENYPFFSFTYMYSPASFNRKLYFTGTFAVVCLMVGHVVEREVETSISPTSSTLSPTNQPGGSSVGDALRLSIYKQESNSSFPSEQELLDEQKLEVAVALSMLVGLFQVGSLIISYNHLFP